MEGVILMSANARDYAFIFKPKKDSPPMPSITKEQLEAKKANAAKYPIKR